MSHLVPCPSCGRHVRNVETACPFCSSVLSLAHVPAPALPRNRLGRAALFAFRAGVVGATALAACSEDNEGNPVPVYGAPAAGQMNLGGSPVYGAPPEGGAPGNAGSGNLDLAGSASLYGGAPSESEGGTGAMGGSSGGAGGISNGEGGGSQGGNESGGGAN